MNFVSRAVRYNRVCLNFQEKLKLEKTWWLVCLQREVNLINQSLFRHILTQSDTIFLSHNFLFVTIFFVSVSCKKKEAALSFLNFPSLSLSFRWYPFRFFPLFFVITSTRIFPFFWWYLHADLIMWHVLVSYFINMRLKRTF